MFQGHPVDISGMLGAHDDPLIRFRALLPVLHERRPRGRVPTRLVSEKTLRFVRTTLLGYMPGFCSQVRPVGPWRPVRLVRQRELCIERAQLYPSLLGVHGEVE